MLDVERLARRLMRALDLPWHHARGLVVEVIAALLAAEAERHSAEDR